MLGDGDTNKLADGRRISSVSTVAGLVTEERRFGKGEKARLALVSHKAAKAAVPCFSVPNFKGKRAWDLPYPV
jgi:hypothetical protein